MMANSSIEVTYQEGSESFIAFYKPTWQWAVGLTPRESIENLYRRIGKQGIGRFPLHHTRQSSFTDWQKGDVNGRT